MNETKKSDEKPTGSEALQRGISRRLGHIKPHPGEIPRLPGIEVAGITLPQDGIGGGDHIVYIDFNHRYDLNTMIREKETWWREEAERMGLSSEKRAGANTYVAHRRKEWCRRLEANRHRAGVLLADVRGHDLSDAFVVGMLHQAFLTGVLYELKIFGAVTPNLFEVINSRFFNSSSIDDFLTMIYGEIADDGTFLFLSAGHPPPLIFSREFDRFMDIPPETIRTYPPIGMMPLRNEVDEQAAKSPLGFKDGYRISEVRLMGHGDLLLLYTDGLMDHCTPDGTPFLPGMVEKIMASHHDASAAGIVSALHAMIRESARSPEDDISFVVIRRI